MKNVKYKYSKTFFLLLLLCITVISCEREVSSDAVAATFSNNPDVYIDGFSAGLDYQPFGDSFQEAFSVDTETKFSGASAMRFDIPAFGVGYGGANFPVSSPRDLTDYDALTFYAKANIAGYINQIGFGINGETKNRYRVTRNNMPITTQWVKYVIPIPDASKLSAVSGLFWYAEGALDATDNVVNTFWIDEMKYEKLGTIAQPRPKIFNGEDRVEATFNDSNIQIDGLTQTFNLSNGIDQTVVTAAPYFLFSTTDVSVATVNRFGEVLVVGEGTAVITAMLGDVTAAGSLTVVSTGVFVGSPVPTVNAADVKSIFSDAYTAATPSNLSPGFGGSTTQVSVNSTGSDSVLAYTNNNFTAIVFENTVDASTLVFMHVDVFVDEPGTVVGFQIRDIGTNGQIDTDTNTGNPIVDDKDLRFTASNLTVSGWNSFDIPLNGNIANQKGNLGAIILTGGPDFILDNIFFYK